ncbi:trypsin-like peptidase domain-containing protein [Streptomyces sp. bgisy022]|uniref:S1C family serine protease n=1 Tax=Streptomyces sp. bgisy022 TaxID=3413769 RepID=UPI003D74D8E1
MNEGKPGPPGERADTSADNAPADTSGAHGTQEERDGGDTPAAGDAQRPVTGARGTADTARPTRDGAPTRPGETDGDGDFALARPAAHPTDAEGDYALSSPQGPPTPGRPDGPHGPDRSGEPRSPHHPAPEPTAPERPDGREAGAPAVPGPSGEPVPGPSGDPRPSEPVHSDPVGPEPVHPESAGPAPTVAGPSTGPVGRSPSVPGPSGEPVGPVPAGEERPTPLHDPDPYSTPPYGEPGPWAPAPPVQHPSTVSAQAAQAAQAGRAAPPHDAPPPGASEAATPPHGTPLSTSYGTPQVPHPTAQGPAPDPVAHGVPAPAAPAPGAPAQPGVPHQEAAVPPPAPGAVPGGPPHPAPQPAAGPDPAGPAPAADPWGRYDPWAAPTAPAPLQMSGPSEDTDKKRRRLRSRIVLTLVLVFGLLCGLVGGIVGAYLERNGGVGAVELPQADKEPADRDPDSVAGIASRALPSVVTLHASGTGAAGTGTGFVLDERGHILTNNHVVEPAGRDGEITVTFHSGDTADATVIGRDSGYDLAVVRVKGVRGLTPLPLGNSDNVRVGDPVVAIGAPFDLAGTVTSGIISARERPITAGGEKGDGSDVSYVDALQTDAPINPGNSGGPLLDAEARVIGINSAIRSAGGGGDLDGGQAGSIGLGFAIPINQGKRVAEELIDTGKATHPVIGITLDMEYSGDGARVGAKGTDGGPPVVTDGPGDKAGIEAGDVITEVNGQRVHSGEELIVKTRAHRPGDRLELTLERDGEERTVSLVLGSSGG